MVLWYLSCFLVWLFLSPQLYADKNCLELKYEDLDAACLTSLIGVKAKHQSIKLSQLKPGDIYLYRTSKGWIGKLQVINVEQKSNACTLYYQAETYYGTKAFALNSSLFIANKLGIWESRSLHLDPLLDAADFVFQGQPHCQLLAAHPETRLGFYEYQPPYHQVESGNKIIFIAVMVLVGVSVVIISYTVLKEGVSTSATGASSLGTTSSDVEQFYGSVTQEGEQEALKNYNKKVNGGLYLYSRPFFKRYFYPVVSKKKELDRWREYYRRMCANAGLVKIATGDDIMAYKLLLTIVFPLFFLVFRLVAETDWPISAALLAALIGFIYPDLWLRSLIKKRRQEIILAMPFIIDMLALSIEAGLDFIAAMARVLEKAPKSSLVDEFDNVIRDIRLGSSRAQALRQMSWRVDEISVNSFCATLIAADSVGASVGPILKSLSQEIRQKRSSLVEQEGAKAATKILLPTILLIVPAVMIIVLAPALMDLLR